MIEAIDSKRQIRKKAGEVGAASFGAYQPLTNAAQPTTPPPATSGISAPQDRVTISAEARETDNLQGMRRVNLESWALGLGSQNGNQVQKQLGVSANLAAPEKLKTETVQRGADLNNPLSAATSPDLNVIGIGEARSAQVVRKGDQTRRTTPFIIDYEAPVVTRESA